eukprot:CFRG0964T1
MQHGSSMFFVTDIENLKLSLENVVVNNVHVLRRVRVTSVCDHVITVGLRSTLGAQLKFQMDNLNLPLEKDISYGPHLNSLFNMIGYVEELVLQPRTTQQIILVFLPEAITSLEEGSEESYKAVEINGSIVLSGKLAYTGSENESKADGQRKPYRRDKTSNNGVPEVQSMSIRFKAVICQSVLHVDQAEREMELDDCVTNQTYVRDFTVWNRSEFALSFVLVVDSPEGQAELCEFSELETGYPINPKREINVASGFSQCRIRMAYSPTTVGQFKIIVQLENLHNMTNIERITIHASVTAEQRSQALWVSGGGLIDFGDVYTQRSSERTIVLRNETMDAMDVFALATDGMSIGNAGGGVPPEITFHHHTVPDNLDDDNYHSLQDLDPSTSLMTSQSNNKSIIVNDMGGIASAIGDVHVLEKARASASVSGSESAGVGPGARSSVGVGGIDNDNLRHEASTSFEQLSLLPNREQMVMVCYTPEAEIADESVNVDADSLSSSSPLPTLASTHHHIQKHTRQQQQQQQLQQHALKHAYQLQPRSYRIRLKCCGPTGEEIQWRVIHATARVCLSKIVLSTDELNFGDLYVGKQYSKAIYVRNLSALAAYIDVRVQSKIIRLVEIKDENDEEDGVNILDGTKKNNEPPHSFEGVASVLSSGGHRGLSQTISLAIPPMEQVRLRVDIRARKVNPEYVKHIHFSNANNDDDSHTLLVRANNVDQHGDPFHSIFYRLVTGNAQGDINFANMVNNNASLRTFTIKSLHTDKLHLDLFTTRPSQIKLYAQKESLAFQRDNDSVGHTKADELVENQVYNQDHLTRRKEKLLESMETSGWGSDESTYQTQAEAGRVEFEYLDLATKSDTPHSGIGDLDGAQRGRSYHVQQSNTGGDKSSSPTQSPRSLDRGFFNTKSSPSTTRIPGGMSSIITNNHNSANNMKNHKRHNRSGSPGRSPTTSITSTANGHNSLGIMHTARGRDISASSLRKLHESISPSPTRVRHHSSDITGVGINGEGHLPNGNINCWTALSSTHAHTQSQTYSSSRVGGTTSKLGDLIQSSSGGAVGMSGSMGGVKDVNADRDGEKAWALDQLVQSFTEEQFLPSHSLSPKNEIDFIAFVQRRRWELQRAINDGRLMEVSLVSFAQDQEITIYVVYIPALPGSATNPASRKLKKIEEKVLIRPMVWNPSKKDFTALTVDKRHTGGNVSSSTSFDTAVVRELRVIGKACTSAVSVGQKYINFGNMTKKDHVAQIKTLIINNNTELPMLYKVVKSGSIASGDLHIREGRAGVVRPFDKRGVNFVFKPSFSGVFKESLKICNVLDETSQEEVTVKAIVKSPMAFHIKSLLVDFGAVMVGLRSKSGSIIVTNNTTHTRSYVIRLDRGMCTVSGVRLEFDFEAADDADLGLISQKNLDKIEVLEQKLKIATRKEQHDKRAEIEGKLRKLRTPISAKKTTNTTSPSEKVRIGTLVSDNASDVEGDGVCGVVGVGHDSLPQKSSLTSNASTTMPTYNGYVQPSCPGTPTSTSAAQQQIVGVVTGVSASEKPGNGFRLLEDGTGVVVNVDAMSARGVMVYVTPRELTSNRVHTHAHRNSMLSLSTIPPCNAAHASERNVPRGNANSDVDAESMNSSLLFSSPRPHSLSLREEQVRSLERRRWRWEKLRDVMDPDARTTEDQAGVESHPPLASNISGDTSGRNDEKTIAQTSASSNVQNGVGGDVDVLFDISTREAAEGDRALTLLGMEFVVGGLVVHEDRNKDLIKIVGYKMCVCTSPGVAAWLTVADSSSGNANTAEFTNTRMNLLDNSSSTSKNVDISTHSTVTTPTAVVQSPIARTLDLNDIYRRRLEAVMTQPLRTPGTSGAPTAVSNIGIHTPSTITPSITPPRSPPVTEPSSKNEAFLRGISLSVSSSRKSPDEDTTSIFSVPNSASSGKRKTLTSCLARTQDVGDDCSGTTDIRMESIPHSTTSTTTILQRSESMDSDSRAMLLGKSSSNVNGEVAAVRNVGDDERDVVVIPRYDEDATFFVLSTSYVEVAQVDVDDIVERTFTLTNTHTENTLRFNVIVGINGNDSVTSEAGVVETDKGVLDDDSMSTQGRGDLVANTSPTGSVGSLKSSIHGSPVVMPAEGDVAPAAMTERPSQSAVVTLQITRKTLQYIKFPGINVMTKEGSPDPFLDQMRPDHLLTLPSFYVTPSQRYSLIHPVTVSSVHDEPLWLQCSSNLAKQVWIYANYAMTVMADCVLLRPMQSVTVYLGLSPNVPMETLEKGECKELVGGVRFNIYRRKGDACRESVSNQSNITDGIKAALADKQLLSNETLKISAKYGMSVMSVEPRYLKLGATRKIGAPATSTITIVNHNQEMPCSFAILAPSGLKCVPNHGTLAPARVGGVGGDSDLSRVTVMVTAVEVFIGLFERHLVVLNKNNPRQVLRVTVRRFVDEGCLMVDLPFPRGDTVAQLNMHNIYLQPASLETRNNKYLHGMHLETRSHKSPLHTVGKRSMANDTTHSILPMHMKEWVVGNQIVMAPEGGLLADDLSFTSESNCVFMLANITDRPLCLRAKCNLDLQVSWGHVNDISHKFGTKSHQHETNVESSSEYTMVNSVPRQDAVDARRGEGRSLSDSELSALKWEFCSTWKFLPPYSQVSATVTLPAPFRLGPRKSGLLKEGRRILQYGCILLENLKTIPDDLNERLRALNNGLPQLTVASTQVENSTCSNYNTYTEAEIEVNSVYQSDRANDHLANSSADSVGSIGRRGQRFPTDDHMDALTGFDLSTYSCKIVDLQCYYGLSLGRVTPPTLVLGKIGHVNAWVNITDEVTVQNTADLPLVFSLRGPLPAGVTVNCFDKLTGDDGYKHVRDSTGVSMRPVAVDELMCLRKGDKRIFTVTIIPSELEGQNAEAGMHTLTVGFQNANYPRRNVINDDDPVHDGHDHDHDQDYADDEGHHIGDHRGKENRSSVLENNPHDAHTGPELNSLVCHVLYEMTRFELTFERLSENNVLLLPPLSYPMTISSVVCEEWFSVMNQYGTTDTPVRLSMETSVVPELEGLVNISVISRESNTSFLEHKLPQGDRLGIRVRILLNKRATLPEKLIESLPTTDSGIQFGTIGFRTDAVGAVVSSSPLSVVTISLIGTIQQEPAFSLHPLQLEISTHLEESDDEDQIEFEDDRDADGLCQGDCTKDGRCTCIDEQQPHVHVHKRKPRDRTISTSSIASLTSPSPINGLSTQGEEDFNVLPPRSVSFVITNTCVERVLTFSVTPTIDGWVNNYATEGCDRLLTIEPEDACVEPGECVTVRVTLSCDHASHIANISSKRDNVHPFKVKKRRILMKCRGSLLDPEGSDAHRYDAALGTQALGSGNIKWAFSLENTQPRNQNFRAYVLSDGDRNWLSLSTAEGCLAPHDVRVISLSCSTSRLGWCSAYVIVENMNHPDEFFVIRIRMDVVVSQDSYRTARPHSSLQENLTVPGSSTTIASVEADTFSTSQSGSLIQTSDSIITRLSSLTPQTQLGGISTNVEGSSSNLSLNLPNSDAMFDVADVFSVITTPLDTACDDQHTRARLDMGIVYAGRTYSEWSFVVHNNAPVDAKFVLTKSLVDMGLGTSVDEGAGATNDAKHLVGACMSSNSNEGMSDCDVVFSLSRESPVLCHTLYIPARGSTRIYVFFTPMFSENDSLRLLTEGDSGVQRDRVTPPSSHVTFTINVSCRLVKHFQRSIAVSADVRIPTFNVSDSVVLFRVGSCDSNRSLNDGNVRLRASPESQTITVTSTISPSLLAHASTEVFIRCSNPYFDVKFVSTNDTVASFPATLLPTTTSESKKWVANGTHTCPNINQLEVAITPHMDTINKESSMIRKERYTAFHFVICTNTDREEMRVVRVQMGLSVLALAPYNVVTHGGRAHRELFLLATDMVRKYRLLLARKHFIRVSGHTNQTDVAGLPTATITAPLTRTAMTAPTSMSLPTQFTIANQYTHSSSAIDDVDIVRMEKDLLAEYSYVTNELIYFCLERRPVPVGHLLATLFFVLLLDSAPFKRYPSKHRSPTHTHTHTHTHNNTSRDDSMSGAMCMIDSYSQHTAGTPSGGVRGGGANVAGGGATGGMTGGECTFSPWPEYLEPWVDGLTRYLSRFPGHPDTLQRLARLQRQLSLGPNPPV